MSVATAVVGPVDVSKCPAGPSLSTVYNDLPSLHAANALVTAAVRETHLPGSIRDIFIEHGVNKKYGLALLHAHFNMKPDERLVEHGPSSSPWSVGQKQESVLALRDELGYVQTRSYRFIGEDHPVAVPYEFKYVEEATMASDPGVTDPNFVSALGRELRRLDLQDVFGIRHLADADFTEMLEITQGRNNVMISGEKASKVPAANQIDALWVFNGDGEPGPTVKCNQKCEGNGGPGHQHKHDEEIV